jgi:hypothetical protein
VGQEGHGFLLQKLKSTGNKKGPSADSHPGHCERNIERRLQTCSNDKLNIILSK